MNVLDRSDFVCVFVIRINLSMHYDDSSLPTLLSFDIIGLSFIANLLLTFLSGIYRSINPNLTELRDFIETVEGLQNMLQYVDRWCIVIIQSITAITV